MSACLCLYVGVHVCGMCRHWTEPGEPYSIFRKRLRIEFRVWPGISLVYLFWYVVEEIHSVSCLIAGPLERRAALLVFRCAASHKQESFEERAERKHTSSTDGPRGRIGNSPSRIGSAIYAKRPWTSSCRASPGTAFINTSKEPRPSVFRQLLLAL